MEILLKKLKEYMFDKDLTVAELAIALGCSRAFLSNLFTGRYQVSERMEYKIRKLLGEKVKNHKVKQGDLQKDVES